MRERAAEVRVREFSRIRRFICWGVVAAATFILSPAFALETADFDAHGVILTKEKYRGRDALKVIVAEVVNETGDESDTIAVLKSAPFHDGTIDFWLAGEPNSAAAAAGGARGFVGIAFRVADPSHYEAIYLRPTNGRAEDQLRRNHSIQYISHPEYPWERLRNEMPGVYESYADMAPGEWIHCRIVVLGTQARLFLGAASQPSLIVSDLKHGDASGRIGLWISSGTVAYFSGLRMRP